MSAAVDKVRQIIHATDAAITRLYLSAFRERSGLLSFMFHALFRNEREMALNHIAPMDRITVALLKRLVEYYLEQGYRFVSPADLTAGLDAGGRYAMITFDDGYFNNTLALPVLEACKVPAVFCIATDNVRQNKCFWWDVLHREHAARGTPRQQFDSEVADLKSLRSGDLEARLIEQFGADALAPRSDIDRPFAPAELRDFARHPCVHLGNHTAGHAILTNYTLEQARAEIAGAQDALREMTGITPLAIAYPNGAYNQGILDVCGQLGLKVGFTVRPQKNRLPLDSRSPQLLRLGRFCPSGAAPIVTQCRTYRSDLQLYGSFRAGYLRLVGGQPD